MPNQFFHTVALITGLSLGLQSHALASDFFAAPNGSPSGDGSIGRPWDLATALGQPAAVRPGDTIWLRGGTYTFPRGGNILCGLRGNASAPITVAQYPSERATLDLKGAAQGLFFTTSPNPAGAAYVNFKNFEVTNSDANRSSSRGSPDIYVRTSDHLKFINLIVHDISTGFALCKEATNTEVYGSIVYYCDDASDPRGYAHGIYIQNVSGYKKATDNIVFNNSGYGIHAYPHADDHSLVDVTLTGNICFNAGSLGSYPPAPDFLLGGEAVALSPVIDSNATYKAAPGSLWNQQIGFGAGCRFARVVDNYFVGTTQFTNCAKDLVLTGNTFCGPRRMASASQGDLLARFDRRLRRLAARLGLAQEDDGFDRHLFPSNRYGTARAKGLKVLLRRNLYEPGRANLAVYNWDRLAVVSVDVRQVLSPGDRYELRSVQDFFGAPVLKGTYDGSPLKIPMNGRDPVRPIGLHPPPASGPEFNAFVLLTTSR